MKAGGNMSVIHLKVPGERCSFSLDHLEQDRSTHVNSNGKYYSILKSSERVKDLKRCRMIGGWIGIQFEKKTNLSNTLRTQGAPRISGKSSSNQSCFPFEVFVFCSNLQIVQKLLHCCKIDLILTSTCKALHQSGVVRLLVRNWWKSAFSPASAQKENRLVSIKPEILSHMISSFDFFEILL